MTDAVAFVGWIISILIACAFMGAMLLEHERKIRRVEDREADERERLWNAQMRSMKMKESALNAMAARTPEAVIVDADFRVLGPDGPRASI